MRLLGLLVALGVVLSACGGAVAQPSATPDESAVSRAAAEARSAATATPTPSPSPPPVYWPLRGTLAGDPTAVRRRPIAVRIGNDVAARPVSGLSKADMVWELLTEAGITRYMAVFHSQEADSIGPVRSARLSDLHYLPMLRGILAHEGASPIVRQRVQAAAANGAFVEIDEWYWGVYFPRVTTRLSPQTVYTSTKNVRAAAAQAGAKDNVDVPLMVSTGLDAPAASGAGARTFTLPYDGAMRVTYAYDSALGDFGAYTRVQGGQTTIDAATGKPVVATNVVVIYTDIMPTNIVEDSVGSLSLEIRSTGSGKATIFNRGQRFDGRWKRSGTDPYAFFVQLDDGRAVPIPLVPGGTTWFHVVPSDWAVKSAP